MENKNYCLNIFIKKKNGPLHKTKLGNPVNSCSKTMNIGMPNMETGIDDDDINYEDLIAIILNCNIINQWFNKEYIS